jgi:hypothetical protein
MKILRILSIGALLIMSSTLHAADDVLHQCLATVMDPYTYEIHSHKDIPIVEIALTLNSQQRIMIKRPFSWAIVHADAVQTRDLAVNITERNPSKDPKELANESLLASFKLFLAKNMQNSTALRDGVYVFATEQKVIGENTNSSDLSPRAQEFLTTYTNPDVATLKRQLPVIVRKLLTDPDR